IFKPININFTPFWGVAFPYGIAFVPTQIATTGILGTALWILFLGLIVSLGFKVLNHIPDSRAQRFTLISSLVITVFLWTSSLLYTPSFALLMLAFIFTGIFIAISQEVGIISSRSINFKELPSTKVASTIIIVLVALGALYLGWVGVEKVIASYHFKKASDLSGIPGTPINDVENQLEKAIKFSSQDIYYLAVAQLNFSRAQMVARSATGTPEENTAIFQSSISKSIAAARSATALNPASYQNWVVLGSIYSAMVPEPLKIDGAYENAQYAYNEALKRNPNNPEISLLLAQLEINKGNVEDARSYIRRAIALKEDYSDAYSTLVQLEIQQNNIVAAISSTENLVQLLPNNPGVYFELGVLKYTNLDYKGAEEALMHALELSPDYANAKYYLALTLLKFDRTTEAKTYLEDLLKSNPDSAELKATLEGLNKKK
ncbi:MAG: tetratricopeptide repeat protein, partial [Patescibacteria group bacterium]